MTDNYLEKITEIYAFVSTGKEGEGVIGKTVTIPGGYEVFMPFVCADLQRVEALKPHALQIKEMSGRDVKLVKFTNRIEIEDI